MRLQDLGDDLWEVAASSGRIRGQVSGRSFRIGDRVKVEIKGVDVAKRQLDLVVSATRFRGRTSRVH